MLFRSRNPWNEYECGNYYARAMASFALLGALSGFRYSAVEKTVWFGPKLSQRPFKIFFSTVSGFGVLNLTGTELQIRVIEGDLTLEKLVITEKGQTRTLEWKAKVRNNAVAVRRL